MSCLITNGRQEVCKDSVGGIDAVYFINRGTYNYETDITYNVTNTDVIDVIANVTTVYKYELKGTSNFEQALQPNADAGTELWQQNVLIVLRKQDAVMHKQLKLMAYGRPSIIVKNRNGQFFIVGLEYGTDMTAGTISNGTQMVDFNGYNFTLTAMERMPANILNCSTESDLLATVLDGASLVSA